jgi:hypothetical protein
MDNESETRSVSLCDPDELNDATIKDNLIGFAGKIEIKLI